jgi:hypothetical protein
MSEPSSAPISIQNLVAQVVEGMRGTLTSMAQGIVAAGKTSDRDLEHRMYVEAATASARYAMQHMVMARPIRAKKYGGGGRLDLLEHALSLTTVDGFHAEFGVYKGESLTFVADRIEGVAYGFDSFEGLPDDWFLDVGRKAYDLGGRLPELKAQKGNVRLVKGWFDQSLPGFAGEVAGPAAFLHIDCDLYESTRCVFEVLGDRVVPGTVIVFDEYWNYPGWENHEFKAFQEFCARRGVTYRYVAFTPLMLSVAVVIEAVG